MARAVSVGLFCPHYIPFDVTPIDCRRTYAIRTQSIAVNSYFRCIPLRLKFSNETIPPLPSTAWLSTIKNTHISSSICRLTCTDAPTRFRCYYSTIQPAVIANITSGSKVSRTSSHPNTRTLTPDTSACLVCRVLRQPAFCETTNATATCMNRNSVCTRPELSQNWHSLIVNISSSMTSIWWPISNVGWRHDDHPPPFCILRLSGDAARTLLNAASCIRRHRRLRRHERFFGYVFDLCKTIDNILSHNVPMQALTDDKQLEFDRAVCRNCGKKFSKENGKRFTTIMSATAICFRHATVAIWCSNCASHEFPWTMSVVTPICYR